MVYKLRVWAPPTPKIQERMNELTTKGGQQLAKEMQLAASAKRNWPIKTGRSRRGLSARAHRRNGKVIIRFYNRMDYAKWVEIFWFPKWKRGAGFKGFFTPARMRKILDSVEYGLREDMREQARKHNQTRSRPTRTISRGRTVERGRVGRG